MDGDDAVPYRSVVPHFQEYGGLLLDDDGGGSGFLGRSFFVFVLFFDHLLTLGLVGFTFAGLGGLSNFVCHLLFEYVDTGDVGRVGLDVDVVVVHLSVVSVWK